MGTAFKKFYFKVKYMIDMIIFSFFYPSLAFFLDLFFKNIFLKDFLYCMLIFVITAIANKKPSLYIMYLLALFYLLFSVYSEQFYLVGFFWIVTLILATYMRNIFLSSFVFPYMVLIFCFFLKIMIFRFVFHIELDNWLYTIGQFMSNIILLLVSLKWFSAVKASGRK